MGVIMRRQNILRQIVMNESGATAIEYGLIAAAIAMAIFASVAGMADQIKALWTGTADRVEQAHQ